MATLLTVTILLIPDLDLKHVADVLDWLFLFFPFYNLGTAIRDLHANFRASDICMRAGDKLAVACELVPNPCCVGGSQAEGQDIVSFNHI